MTSTKHRPSPLITAAQIWSLRSDFDLDNPAVRAEVLTCDGRIFCSRKQFTLAREAFNLAIQAFDECVANDADRLLEQRRRRVEHWLEQIPQDAIVNIDGDVPNQTMQSNVEESLKAGVQEGMPPDPRDQERLAESIRTIFAASNEKATSSPDNHVQSIGQSLAVLAQLLAGYYYGIAPREKSNEGYDGIHEGRKVEVKLITVGHRIGIARKPEHLLVLQLMPDGHFEEAYNGPGELVWSHLEGKRLAKKGLRQVSLSTLQQLQNEVDLEQRLTRIR